MDFKELGSNLGLDEDEFIELVELFATSAASDLDKLEEAYNNNDTDQAAEAAHSLKGSAGNLGFVELSQLSKEVEDNARKNNLNSPEETLSKLKEMLLEITKQLENQSS